MNRLATLFLIGLAGLLASCGSSTSSSTQPGTDDTYSLAVSPDQFTLNAGDWSSIAAAVDLSVKNSAPKAVTPQPTIKFFSSDPRVSVSPAGEVCAGLWDTKYLTCTPTVKPTVNGEVLDLPTGQVTITAYNASHNVSGTTLVTVHPRAASITLSSPDWLSRIDPTTSQPVKCISQNDQVKYLATTAFVAGATGGTVLDNDYTWVVADPNVASVSTHGFVIARNPGVTTVVAQLNGMGSVPLAFATCPPSSIVLAASTFTNGTPIGPFTTSDLDSSPPNSPACIAAGTCVLNKGDQRFLTATLFDALNKPLLDSNNVPLTVPLTFVTSDALTGSVSSVLPLSSKLSTNTSGRFSVIASCEPATCNASVADFVSPAGHFTGKDLGFGYPIYSNVIGVTVQGTTASTVLVTNSAEVKTPLFRLFAYDSESLTVTHEVALQKLPNSLVVAPNGAKAYLGSNDGGLMVVDLTSFQSSVQSFPIIGGSSTDLITGKVLGVSPDSRFVLVSDVTKGLVFRIDTTGSKVAARYTIPNIDAVTFAADNSNTWIAANPPVSDTAAYSGVYVFNSDTFVPTFVPTLANQSTHVRALAWVPDGQSYFVSGDQILNYSTCDDRLNTQAAPAGSPINLATTVLGGVPHVVGLSGSQWFDYSVTTSAQVGGQTVTSISGLKASGPGNVCQSTVTVTVPVPVPPVPDPAASTLQCANQVSFSQTREAEFVTGVDPSCVTTAESVIHGYDVNGKQEITLSTASPLVPLSGGVLNDGRKLFFGTYDGTNAQLHRINLTTDPTTGLITGTEDVVPDPTNPIPANVSLVPSFVAVVPK